MVLGSRAAALRRCAALLASRGAEIEREATAGWQRAFSTCQARSLTSAPTDFAQQQQQQQQQQQRRQLSTSADELPLPELHVKDDLEAALGGEADLLPLLLSDADAAQVLLSGQRFVSTDNIATLPLGQSLREEAEFQEQQWAFETGKLARLANGSCLVQAGGTSVLAAATCQAPPFFRRDAQKLQFEVEYREKLYAVGRIPGTFNKREGQAKEHEVLTGRRIHRALRPLFPKGYAMDAAVHASVLSADGGTDPDVMAISAASSALMCSDMPWAGPVAAARAALLPDGSLVVGPSVAQQEAAALNLLVACTADRVTSLEAEGDQVPEADFLRVLRAAVEAAQQLVEPQRQLAAQTGRQTRPAQLSGADPAGVQKVIDLATPMVEAILRNSNLTKASRTVALQQAKAYVLERLKATGGFRTEFARVPGSGCVSPGDMEHAFTAVLGAAMRRMAVEEGWRCDGRGSIDVRPIHCELNAVPVVHGSALFSRGETQCLCTVTVGRRGEQQKVESLLGGEGLKRLFVNYSFPPYAVNETSNYGQRREWGHSELAEKALLPVMPDEADFPFSLRLNADTLASAGSSSMAAVSGGALALADAGVPIKALVAGVSVGLMTEAGWCGESRLLPSVPVHEAAEVAPVGRYELLTDLQGMEDQLGDMDLKVAGTRQGITACQLDVKLYGGVPLEVVEQGLAAAARGRATVLAAMEAVLPKERPADAPMFGSVRVPQTMIGRVIGTGGSVLREVEETCGARVDIDDTGLVSIFASSQESYKKASDKVLNLTGESVKEGQVYRGTVTRLLDYGALINLTDSGLRCLLHISEVSPVRVRSIEEELRIGQEVEVLCTGRDAKGQVKLSRKAVMVRQQARQRSAKEVAGGGAVDPDH